MKTRIQPVRFPTIARLTRSLKLPGTSVLADDSVVANPAQNVGCHDIAFDDHISNTHVTPAKAGVQNMDSHLRGNDITYPEMNYSLAIPPARYPAEVLTKPTARASGSTPGSREEETHDEDEKLTPRAARVRQQLAEGILPAEFLELVRAVNPYLRFGQSFQKAMTELMKRLLPDHDFKKEPIQFLLTDTPDYNAGACTEAKPPVILVTQGLFKQAKNLDEVALVIGHEYGHIDLERKLGPGESSKAEEGAGDVTAMRLAHAAGFDVQVALDPRLSPFFNNETPDLLLRVAQILDVHPTPRNRLRMAEKVVAFLDQEQGNIAGRKPTLLPQQFKSFGQGGVYRSAVDARLAASGYEGLSIAGKIDILQAVLPCILDELGSPDARTEDLAHRISDLPIRSADRETKEAFHALVDQILDLRDKTDAMNPIEQLDDLISELYISGGKAAGGISSPFGDTIFPPSGRVRQLAAHLEQFIGARDQETAQRSAILFQDWLEKNNLSAKLLKKVDLPSFRLPDMDVIFRALHPNQTSTRRAQAQSFDTSQATKPRNSLIRIPWQKHYQWAQRVPPIASALLLLGVNDARLLPFISPEDSIKILTHQTEPIRPDVSSSSDDRLFPLAISNFQIDPENGFITGTLEDRATIPPEQDFDLQAARLAWKHLNQLYAEASRGNAEARASLLQAVKHIDPDAGYKMELVGIDMVLADFPLFFQASREWLVIPEKAAVLAAEFDRQLHLNFEAAAPVIRQFYLGGSKEPSLENLHGGATDLDRENPFVDFAIRDSHHLFSPTEKAKIFSHAEFMMFPDETHSIYGWDDLKNHLIVGGKPKRKISMFEDDAKQLCAIFGIDTPATPGQLLQVVETLSAMDARVSNRLAVFLTSRYFSAHPHQALDWGSLAQHLDPKAIEWMPNLRAAFQRKVRQHKWPGNLESLIETYCTFERARIFPADHTLQNQKLEEITERLAQAAAPEQRIALAEKLLTRTSIPFPSLRNQLVDIWADAHGIASGPDTGEEQYRDSLLDQVRPVLEKVPYEIRTLMAARLAKAVVSQAELSYNLRDCLTQMTRGGLESTQKHGILAEAALEKMRNKDTQRNLLLSFLVNPLTDESAREAGLGLKESHDRQNLYYLDERIDPSIPLNEQDWSIIIKPPPEEALAARAKLLYENFWESPFLARVAMLDELLNPPRVSALHPDVFFEHAFEYTAGLLLPPGMAYASEARAILRRYCKVVPEYERGLLLTAMLVAYRKNEGDENEGGIGRRLSVMLELMGPAHVKLGQAIHSHPKTPEDLRADMGRLKDSADMPSRWDFFSHYEATVPADVRARIGRIGDIMNAASYYVVADVEGGVLSLLRPHAENRAERGFGILEDFTKRFHPAGTPASAEDMRSTLRQLVQQARRMKATEVSHEAAKVQFATAETLYADRRVNADGMDFAFNPARLLEAGPGYRLMSRAEGVHFNQLPESTPEEVAFKKSLAKAYVALEFDLILRGGKFDHDRHGAQLKVSGNQVTLFDFGAMALREPTSADRQALADLFLDAALEMNGGRDYDSFSHAVVGAVKKHERETGEVPEYLITAEKGILALGDFIRMLEPGELQSILAYAARRETVHPEIRNRILERIVAEPGLGLSLMGLASNRSEAIQIKN